MLKAALRAKDTGRPWRGMALEVETSSGRGGRSGLTYKVSVRGLLETYKAALKGSSSALAAPVRPQDFKQRLVQDRSRSERQAIIAEAVEFAPGTPERRAAIAAAAVASGKSEKTIGRWCAAYDAGGYTGLGRAKPKNTGERRHSVSAVFDKAFLAAGYPADALASVSLFIEGSIKGLWQSRAADAGWAEINRSAEYILRKECEDLGFVLPRSAMRIGRHGVERHRQHSIVNLKRNNAKAYQDQQPGISRNWRDEEPMGIVVGDVKHLDVIVQRANGKPAWPKMIAFMDGGVGRVFHYLVLCDERRSITQELVIEAFIAMATDPLWGFPKTLLLDNGSEFGALDLIAPALARLNNRAGREIIHALPYQAKSKPIEGKFAHLDRYCFSTLPGYAGGDRQKKKTQNVGREPEAFNGSWDEFVATVDFLIKYYHGRFIGGQWNASPDDILREKVEAGWRPIMPDPFALDMAFHKQKQARVVRGIITTPRGKFYHPELAKLPGGTSIRIAIPYRAADAPIAWIPGGEPVRLAPETLYNPRDIEGAKEAGRRRTAANQAVKALEIQALPVDPVAIKRQMAADMEPVVIPGRLQGIDHGTTLSDLGQVLQLVDQSDVKEADDQSAEERRRDRETQRLLKGKSRAAA